MAMEHNTNVSCHRLRLGFFYLDFCDAGARWQVAGGTLVALRAGEEGKVEAVRLCFFFFFCMGEEVNFALNVTEIEFPFLGMTLPPTLEP